MTAPNPLEQAKEALRQGHKKQAREPLLRLLKEEPRNEIAWLWLCAACSTPQERRLCLQRVLQINPQNEMAQAALQELGRSTSATPTPPNVQPAPARTFPCPKCGAKMTYRPAERSLYCSHCEHRSPIDEEEKVEERTFQGALFFDQAHTWGVDLRFVRCSSCGGQLAVPPQESSLRCPFCGSPQVVEQSPERPLVKLDSIAPFQFDLEEARRHLREWLGNGWLRPSDAQQVASVIELHGVYLPFWTFDGSATARWRATRRTSGGPGPVIPGARLAVDERYGETCELFDDVMICASNRIPESMIEGIYPFDTDRLVQYSPEYLAGWPAEVSQLSLAEASIQGRAHMSELTRRKARREASDMGMAEARVSSSEANVISYKHVLLPVWLGIYSYKGQRRRVIINGQTGKVWGQAPVSGTRLLFLSFLITVAIGLLALSLWLTWPSWGAKLMELPR